MSQSLNGVALSQKRSFKQSMLEYENAKQHIPGGVKKMNQLDDVEHFPLYFQHARGHEVTDLDGHTYIDLISGKGSIILGYAHPVVNQAVVDRITDGNITPLNSPLQNKLAAQIKNCVTSSEMVRFFRTGSCATAAAIRLARAFTGRELVLSAGYHGWHDWASAGRSGVPVALGDVFMDFKFELETLQQVLQQQNHRVACVMVTPEPCFYGADHLRQIQSLCQEHGVLFVLDEVKTGFRYHLGGVQTAWNLRPDLSTFSKAMANGFPISAVVGREEVMISEEKTHLSGTFDVEMSSMAAALATLEVLQTETVLPELWETGKMLLLGMNQVFQHHQLPAATLHDNPTQGFVVFESDELAQAFYRACCQRGVLFYPNDNINLTRSHSSRVIQNILQVCDDVTQELSRTFPQGMLTDAALKRFAVKRRVTRG